MGITTTFDPAKREETIMRILVEFFRDSSCFGSGSSATTSVVPYSKSDKESLPLPRLEISIIGGPQIGTGAGRQNKEAYFWIINADLTVKVSKSADWTPEKAERQLIRECDIISKYLQSTTGYSALGNAGLRKANLSGPFSVNDKNYYQKKLNLSAEIEVVRGS